MRRVAAIGLWLVPALAAAAEPDPQQHEIDVSVDIGVESGANAALFDAMYIFTPAGIDRRDVLPAIVRRFERHPSAVWARIAHLGATRETVTGIRLGGIYQPFDGALYLQGEGGVERDLTNFDRPTTIQGGEYGYFAARLRGEVGFRPTDLWSIGAFYEARPVIGTDTDDSLPPSLQSERSGGEHTFGATTTFVTPGERLFATVDGFGYIADWTFTGFYPGDTTIHGFGADLRMAYQLTFWTSLQLRGTITSNHWVDARAGDSGQGVIVGPLDRQATSGGGALDLVYWHQSRFAFRFSLGGGYRGATPQHATRATGIFSLGIGTQLRF
jgi:hypothetical protein